MLIAWLLSTRHRCHGCSTIFLLLYAISDILILFLVRSLTCTFPQSRGRSNKVINETLLFARPKFKDFYQPPLGLTLSVQSTVSFSVFYSGRLVHILNYFHCTGKDYTYRDTFDLATTVLSPCGVASVLNIQSDIRVSNSKNTKGSGYIATDSVSA